MDRITSTTINFWRKSSATLKPRNSTKRLTPPPVSEIVSCPCDFYNGYDWFSPVVVIDAAVLFGLTTNDSLNIDYIVEGGYATIVNSGGGRNNGYYFIDSVTWGDGLLTVYLTLDVAAVYRSEILSSVQYVERSTKIDTDIDQDFPVNWQRTRVKSVAEERIFPLPAFSPGSYIIGVAGVRGICYYNLAEDSFTNLTKLLFATPQDTLWESLVDAAVTSITRTFLNPMDFLLSATWVPLLREAGQVEEIYLGYWNTGVKGVRVDVGEILYQQSGTIAFPPNPYAEFKPYLQAEQYADYELYVPCCGSVRLQPGLYPGGADAIYYHAEIDYLGNICVGYRYLPSDVSDMDGVVTGYCGSAVPISSSSGMLFLTQKSESSGGQSANFLSARQQNRAYIVGTFSNTKDNSGVPGGLYRGRRLLSVGSWYQVISPKVDWQCLDVERRAIEQMMADGIYCE